MRETRADTAQAFFWALLLHALLFGAMFVGLLWTRATAPISVAGSPVTAELIDANALSPAMRRTLRNRPEPVTPPPEPEDVAPLPQPLPEPAPQDAVAPPQQSPQDFIPVPDRENQEAVVDAPTPTPADEKKEQDLKRKQEQVDLTEQKRQQEVEQQRRLAAEQQERDRKLAEIRRKREAAAREVSQATRQADLAEQRLRQLADARATQATGSSTSDASPPPGNNGVDASLRARYAAALQEAIVSKWTRPESIPLGARCTLLIRQLPGGQVMDVEVGSPCSYDEQGQRSIEAAVRKAQPLPYAGFEQVFSRNLTLNFTAQDR
ncbi:cell envelope integrity protein TolA [Lysobacter panacisoli]|uniref:Cell envelope integrity protein TolA n=1 Tax=Lysobacter panacisoli TaxID=1255263 RepID=A0ABP9L546_9GAMM|nr:cell envelope integrity protein TolA [Lysobacter panacisoli]